VADTVKLTVVISADNAEHLHAAAERTGLSRTDTVGRALAVYDGVTAALASGGGALDVADNDGPWCELIVSRPKSRRRWWRRGVS
jgi:hypothetical protein